MNGNAGTPAPLDQLRSIQNHELAVVHCKVARPIDVCRSFSNYSFMLVDVETSLAKWKETNKYQLGLAEVQLYFKLVSDLVELRMTSGNYTRGWEESVLNERLALKIPLSTFKKIAFFEQLAFQARPLVFTQKANEVELRLDPYFLSTLELNSTQIKPSSENLVKATQFILTRRFLAIADKLRRTIESGGQTVDQVRIPHKIIEKIPTIVHSAKDSPLVNQNQVEMAWRGSIIQVLSKKQEGRFVSLRFCRKVKKTLQVKDADFCRNFTRLQYGEHLGVLVNRLNLYFHLLSEEKQKVLVGRLVVQARAETALGYIKTLVQLKKIQTSEKRLERASILIQKKLGRYKPRSFIEEIRELAQKSPKLTEEELQGLFSLLMAESKKIQNWNNVENIKSLPIQTGLIIDALTEEIQDLEIDQKTSDVLNQVGAQSDYTEAKKLFHKLVGQLPGKSQIHAIPGVAPRRMLFAERNWNQKANKRTKDLKAIAALMKFESESVPQLVGDVLDDEDQLETYGESLISQQLSEYHLLNWQEERFGPRLYEQLTSIDSIERATPLILKGLRFSHQMLQELLNQIAELKVSQIEQVTHFSEVQAILQKHLPALYGYLTYQKRQNLYRPAHQVFVEDELGLPVKAGGMAMLVALPMALLKKRCGFCQYLWRSGLSTVYSKKFIALFNLAWLPYVGQQAFDLKKTFEHTSFANHIFYSSPIDSMFVTHQELDALKDKRLTDSLLMGLHAVFLALDIYWFAPDVAQFIRAASRTRTYNNYTEVLYQFNLFNKYSSAYHVGQSIKPGDWKAVDEIMEQVSKKAVDSHGTRTLMGNMNPSYQALKKYKGRKIKEFQHWHEFFKDLTEAEIEMWIKGGTF